MVHCLYCLESMFGCTHILVCTHARTCAHTIVMCYGLFQLGLVAGRTILREGEKGYYIVAIHYK